MRRLRSEGHQLWIVDGHSGVGFVCWVFRTRAPVAAAKGRWIDLPEHYVERALRTRLRATSGLRLTDDLRAPTLHVRVLAFDDRLAPAHTANVALAVTLEDREHGRFLERTFNARVGIDDGDPASMAEAMGQALDDAVAQVADAVRVSVRARGVHFPE